MGLEETVFRDVAAVLQTRFPGRPESRDSVMFATALDHVRAAPDTTPLFLFLFVRLLREQIKTRLKIRLIVRTLFMCINKNGRGYCD
jgi:hypothetical protein